MVTSLKRVDELKLDDFEGELTQTIRLFNISWQTYKLMLSEMGNHRSTRIAYDQGVLTIKMPSKLHEIVNRLLARILTTLTEELELEVVSIGSTTLNRSDLQKGAEPDTGLYIQNADRLAGLNPDLPPNLPPDLVIEVDITSPSTQRMVIYKALGVPEVWRYTKRNSVVIYHLKMDDQMNDQMGSYVESANSKAVPQLSADKLNEFLTQRQNQSENQTIRDVRRWIQSLTQHSD
ncbi:MAG: Uma2 family endonuclease [Cyanobacteria bacterium P01_D01_bin.1]